MCVCVCVPSSVPLRLAMMAFIVTGVAWTVSGVSWQRMFTDLSLLCKSMFCGLCVCVRACVCVRVLARGSAPLQWQPAAPTVRYYPPLSDEIQ